jgi:para-nitrobenzyl esterase
VFFACSDSTEPAPEPGPPLAARDAGQDPHPELDAGSALDASRVLDTGAGLGASFADAGLAAVDAALDASGDVDAGQLAGLTLTIESGRIEGKREAHTRMFLGIPYAAPPVGALRFAPAQREASWTGTRNAKAFGSPCIQPVGDLLGPFDEDCLTLNVFTPDVITGPLPVMVFFHGGGVMGGSMGYPSQWLSGPWPVVVVTLNYRLGPLGNLVLPELDGDVPSGNLGLRDQQRALAWVRDNIAAFAGDPANVTLFGESFGSMSACFHAFARGSEALAQRYIMQSGSCVDGILAPLSKQTIADRSSALAQRMCPLASDIGACLRSQPDDAFAPSLLEVTDWRPYVDGDLLPASPREQITRGELRARQIIIGYNKREWSAFTQRGVPTPSNLLEMQLMVPLYYPDDAAALLAYYAPERDAEVREAFVRLQNDGMYRCAARMFAADMRAAGGNAYVYRFDIDPGAHAQELDYVFGWPVNGVSTLYPEAPQTPIVSVLEATQRYWTSFARGGDPNLDARTPWPRYEVDAPTLMALGDPPHSENELEDDPACALWKPIYAR